MRPSARYDDGMGPRDLSEPRPMTWQPPRAPRGTADILPDEARRWQRVEETARAMAERFGYREMRIPLFEATELYVRGIGDATDIVEKEMFAVGKPVRAGEDGASQEKLSLRPEFTAGIVRAYREHGLDKIGGFLKVYSLGPIFRYERPQKGRLRQFHQFNVEALGSTDPLVDAEMIALAGAVIEGVDIPDFVAQINSIGHEAPECRGAYRELLRERLRPRLGTLCESCRARFDRNVFRVLDCKECAEKTADLPPMAEHLCADCAPHFAAVRAGLDRIGVRYVVNARIVRGFDYATRTVFEFPSARLGAQNALGGGCRYDRLIPDMGGPEVGACGFALGMERLLLAMSAGDAAAPAPERPRAVCVVATPAPAVRLEALALVMDLRRAGIEAELDLEGKSVKAQMRAANKLGFGLVAILGEDELAAGVVTLKHMRGEGGEAKVARAAVLAEVRAKQARASGV
jgi:histidyl-tRNA synthetase